MRTDPLVEETIAQLTPSERDAACGRFTFTSAMAQDEGENRLRQLGVWHARPQTRGGPLTEHGKAVRRRLEAMSTGAG